MSTITKLALRTAPLAAILALAATQAPGTVLTADDIEGDFLFRRPFPVGGREWIAVVSSGGAPMLSSASVRWEAGLDAGDSVFALSVDPGDPTLLIAGVRQVHVGPVVAATGGPEPLTPEWSVHDISLGSATYTLTLASSDPMLCDATITLGDGTRSQTLYRADDQEFSCDEPHFDLDWAGDLDGDGRLDIVTTLSPKYSYYPRRLWLSSAARAGELVGLVAQYDGGD